MFEYRKLIESFKTENDGCTPAKVANLAKPEPTLAPLAALAAPHPDIQDFIDDIEERAGIMQHDAPDAYRTRAEAWEAAYEDTKKRWLGRKS